MTVASIIDPSGTATTVYLDSGKANPSSTAYSDGYVQHTFSAHVAGQKLRVTEAGDVDVVVGGESSVTVTLAVNDYAVIVGDDATSPPEPSYALGETGSNGGDVVITYAYAEPSDIPAVTTDAATDVASTTATLNGTLTDMAGMTGLRVYFIWDESDGFLNNSTTDVEVSSTGAFSALITGLTPETEYEFRAVVIQTYTTWTASSTQTFTTTAASTVPVITVSPAAAIGEKNATLIAYLSDMGGKASLDISFEYGTTTAYGTTTTAQTRTTIGYTTQEVEGLSVEATYHFRAKVTDGTSTWYSSDRIFTTSEDSGGESTDIGGYVVELGPAEEGTPTVAGTDPGEDPNDTYFVARGTLTYYNETGLTSTELRRCRVQYYTVGGTYSDWSDWLETYPGDVDGDGAVDDDGLDVDTDAATNVETTTATVNGELVDMGGHSAVDVYFRITQGTTLIEETTSQELTGTGTFSANLTGLDRNTVYTCVAIAQAEGEQDIGNSVQFCTGGLIVNTLNADDLAETTATLNGELVDLNGEASLDVYFEWGTNFENSTTPAAKSTLGLFDAAISGLTARTEYVFRAAATDGTDTWYGEALTFTTTFDVVVVTFFPVDLANTSCTLQGSINSTLATADYYFEYGFTTAYGNTTSLTEITETDGAEAVSAAITGLTEGTTYHCRLVVVDDSTSPSTYYYGNDIEFVTPETKTVTSHTDGLWLFDVAVDSGTKYWSTRAVSSGGHTYTAQVIPGSFQGVESRVDFGSGLLSSSDLTFELYFDSSTTIENMLYELEGSEVLITLTTGEGVAAEIGKRWRFIVERATFAYGVIKCYCKSILQYNLTGDWPKTKNPQEIWPSSDPDIYTNYCVPVIFGTAYIPIKSVNTGEGAAPFNTRKYVLGPSGPTYTVEEVMAPRVKGSSTWDSGSYTFTQSTHNSHRLVQFLIDETQSPAANGVWTQGAAMLLPFVKYSRSDTVNITNPADIIAYILRDMGVKSSHIDTGTGSTFEAAKATFSARGLVWQGGFWEKQSREAVLSSLLSMCDAYLYEGNKIELHVFTNSNHEFFDKTLESSFRVNPTLTSQNNGGPVEWQGLDTPQDVLPGKTTVSIDPFEDDVTSPSRQPFQYRFQYGTILPQKAGILFYQKQHTKNRVSFSSSVLDITNLSTLIPGKVITLYNDQIFRLSGGVVVTSMRINYDLTVDFSAVELTHMNRWEDLDPDAVTIVTDSSVDTMS